LAGLVTPCFQGKTASGPKNLLVFGAKFNNQVKPMAVVELNKDNFEQTIKDNDFVIVDFWAPWCGPCRSFAPVYDKVSTDHDDVVFAKINTEDEQEIAAHFRIRSIPTLMIFREQVIIFAQPGALAEGSFRQLLEKAKELDMAEVRKQVEEQQKGTA
jgi:thioredoxin 1